MPFKIVRGDITKMDVDVIVNAANEALSPGGGVCGAIFNAAGYERLKRECAKIGGCKTGEAVITEGFDLKAKYIIHTPGPIFNDGAHGEAEKLFACYTSSLRLAAEHGAESIAFPLISSGIYGYPKGDALRIATDAIIGLLTRHDMDIYMVIYDREQFAVSTKIYRKDAFDERTKLLDDVKSYIDDRIEGEESSAPGSSHYKIGNEKIYDFKQAEAKPKAESADIDLMPSEEDYSSDNGSVYSITDLQRRLRHMDKSFSQYLLELIDKSGMTDAQVYKRANIDRKLFSKIRTNPQYRPGKITAVAFALALCLNLNATRDLIGRAGYALTRSNKFDIIIEYFISRGEYDIFEINEVLFAFDQPLIGA